jgi:hypothetical protein
MAPHSSSSKPIILSITAVLLGVTALVARAQGGAPGGGSPPPRPAIRAFAAQGTDWAWIVARGEETELHLGSAGTSGTPGQTGAKGNGWTDLALDGSDVWLLQREARQGALLRVKRQGGEPEVVVSSLESPAALLVRDDGVYWLEASPAADPGLAFIPPLAGRLRLKCRDRSGAIRTVTDWTVGGATRSQPGDLMAGPEGRLYACIRSSVATEIYSVPSAGGIPVRVAGELGEQSATSAGGQLLWTAPSREATPESGVRCLQRLRPDGSAELVAEWLSRSGSLAQLGDRLYYAGLEGLYRIPDRFGTPVYRHKIRFGLTASDGKHIISLTDDNPVICGSGSD